MNGHTTAKTVLEVDGAPRPSQIAHVVLLTTRFGDMVRWYKHALSMVASFEDDNLAFLTFDQEHHRVALVRAPDIKERVDGHVGVHHVAFTYRSLRDLLTAHERLAGVGVTPYWAVNHGITISLYYNDPDRNRVELQVDTFHSAEEGIAYCATPEFAENPVGVDIDPGELLARLRAGASEAELKVRPNIGPRSLDSYPTG